MKTKILKQKKKVRSFGIAGMALVITASALLSVQMLHAQPTAEVRALVPHKTTTLSKKTTPSPSKNSSAPSIATSTKTGNGSSSGTAAGSSTGVASSTAVSAVQVAPTVPAAANLYLDPTNDIVIQARAYMNAHGSDAGLEALIAQPIAKWYGDWNTNVQADVNTYVTAASNAGKTPVLVTYNIPNRDCGGQSAGGVQDAAAYSRWITSFAAGIGSRPAIVIVEPDALAANCYTDARAAIISSAVKTLVSTTSASVYLDAGNAAWVSAGTIAGRLQKSGIDQATGFSLNVSNFLTTSTSVAYGKKLSALVANKHFVIDTSRNGNGATADYQWCNPAGRALGQFPTLQTNNNLVDAYLWVKGPGGSDGACGPNEAGTTAPAAGIWWPQYALMLVRNSGL